jgi:hypothetical protein
MIEDQTRIDGRDCIKFIEKNENQRNFVKIVDGSNQNYIFFLRQ